MLYDVYNLLHSEIKMTPNAGLAFMLPPDLGYKQKTLDQIKSELRNAK